ncbi:MAG: preprotein translocase subunit YajC [Acidobacteria bacterium]|nr:MAG: preprotein translocase subunit YajC [Acidobacteriota bacterium]
MIALVGQVNGLGLLAAASPPGEGGGGFLSGPLLPMGMVFLLIYFMVIRPSRNRQKALQAMISKLTRGDKVITNGGIHGMVVGITDDIIQVRVADQVTIEVSRNAIAAKQPSEEGET